MPSATSWPNSTTVPCQARLDHDLLGLNYHALRDDCLAHTTADSLEQNVECPHDQTALQAEFAGHLARGLSGIDRFIAEAPTEQGAVYFRGDGLHQNRVCYCLEP